MARGVGLGLVCGLVGAWCAGWGEYIRDYAQGAVRLDWQCDY